HEIREGPAGDKIAAVTPTIETFAILQFRAGGRGPVIAKPVRLMGIDPQGRAEVGGFAEYLVRQKGAASPNFDLTPEALQRHEWKVRQNQLQDAPNVPAPKLLRPLVPDPNAIPEPKMDEKVGIEPP